MKHKKLCNLIFILLAILTTSVFAEGNKRVTDAEIGAILPTANATIGNSNMIDTSVTIENGDLWIWGFRNAGISGLGHNAHRETAPPQRVEKFVTDGINITQAAAGGYHILALDENGDVWGWGENYFKQSDGNVCNARYIITPCRVLQGKDVIQIGAGEYISLALTKSGEVYTWGDGQRGQTGNGTKNAINGFYKIPQEYFNNQPVVLIGAAYEGGYAVNASGEIFGWGDDEANSFGYPKSFPRVRPTKLNIQVNGKKIKYICGGNAFTEYLFDDGQVWGLGNKRELGIGAKSGTTSTPVLIMNNVKTLYCRYISSLAITVENEIYTWGTEGYEMGGNSPTMRNHHKNITKVDGGKHHIIYWTDKGDVYGAGYGAAHKFGHYVSGTSHWPGIYMSNIVNKAIKGTYGEDYISGQGQ